jgi:hypothetical protein
VLVVTAIKDCSIATGMMLAAIQEEARRGASSDPQVEAPPVPVPESWAEASPILDANLGANGRNGHDGKPVPVSPEQSSASVARFSGADGEPDPGR